MKHWRKGSMNMNERPLLGKTCLIPRQGGQGKDLAEKIRRLGGEPLSIPLIDFKEAEPSEAELARLKGASGYDWFVFTSKNGVDYFFRLLKKYGIPFPEGKKAAVVGKKTKEAAEKHGWERIFVPSAFTGEQMAKELPEAVKKDERVLICKGNLAGDVIFRALSRRGFRADEIVVYETFFPEESGKMLVEKVKSEKLDILLFTSPSTVEHFMSAVRRAGLEERVKDAVVAAIGPVTKKKAEEYGLDVKVCPSVHSTDDLVKELIETISHREEESKWKR